MSHLDGVPSTPGKFKADKAPPYRLRFHGVTASISKFTVLSAFFAAFFAAFFSAFVIYVFVTPFPSPTAEHIPRRFTCEADLRAWEQNVTRSVRKRPSSGGGLTVLVTGAAGFVGSHVSIQLKRRGDGILGIDNFNGNYDQRLKRDRQKLLEHVGIFVVEGDLNNGTLLSKLFEVAAFTHVMHLAAQSGDGYAMQNPSSYVHSNVAGFVNLLEVCKSANPHPAIVWASSSSVYGLNSKVPFSENDQTDQPASLDAATKKSGEEIAHAYNHIYGLSITGLRFSTVYGPWGRPDMAYFSLAKKITMKSKVIPCAKDPNQGSDFTYIDDIVKGCLAALDTANNSTGSGGKKRGNAQLRIYNLGNTSPVPVSQLRSVLEKILKVKAKTKVLPLPTNRDMRFTHANISLAYRELGYKPTTDLETGMKKFVRWYRNYYSHLKPGSW